MNTLLNPLKEWADHEQAYKGLCQGKTVSVSGCIDSEKINIMESLCSERRHKLILTYSEQRVRDIVMDLGLYERNVLVFPAKDLIFYQADIHGGKLVTDRMAVIRRILEGRAMTVVTTFDAIMTHMVPCDIYRDNVVDIASGSQVDEKKLATKLLNMGYSKTKALYLLCFLQVLLCGSVIISYFLGAKRGMALLLESTAFVTLFFSFVHYTNRAVIAKQIEEAKTPEQSEENPESETDKKSE